MSGCLIVSTDGLVRNNYICVKQLMNMSGLKFGGVESLCMTYTSLISQLNESGDSLSICDYGMIQHPKQKRASLR